MLIMAKRKNIPGPTEVEVLLRSARRCCVCFGLNRDLDEKRGQVSHLDRNPSNIDLENLVFLCLPHQDQYDTRTSQSKGLTIAEVKEYRSRLHDAVREMRQGVWPVGHDIPMLEHTREMEPTGAIPTPGIQFCDKDPSGIAGFPLLYLTVYSKPSRFFGRELPSLGEKWLYLEANMRFALNLRIQVRAWHERDVDGLMHFLRTGERAYDLHGPRPTDDQPGDYFLVWRENNENRL